MPYQRPQRQRDRTLSTVKSMTAFAGTARSRHGETPLYSLAKPPGAESGGATQATLQAKGGHVNISQECLEVGRAGARTVGEQFLSGGQERREVALALVHHVRLRVRGQRAHNNACSAS